MIRQRQTIEELASEVRHLTAPFLPRTIESKRLDPIAGLTGSLLRMRDLIDRLRDETGTLRGELARLSTAELRKGLPESDFSRMVDITNCLCGESGVSLDDLRSRSRRNALVQVRHMVMRALHHEGFNYSEIGRFLDRDHGAVMHAVKKGAR